jgi:hypothetical protein
VNDGSVSTRTEELPVLDAPVPEAAEKQDDKRKQPRFDVANRALVNVLGSKETVNGQIADLSQTGFKLLLPAGFPVGEIIRAEVDDEVFVAVVCYSKKTREGYSIGTEMVHSIKRVHLDDLVGEWGVRS